MGITSTEQYWVTLAERRRKLTPQQIEHARKLIEKGQRREEVAALLNVDRTTLYRALAQVNAPNRGNPF